MAGITHLRVAHRGCHWHCWVGGGTVCWGAAGPGFQCGTCLGQWAIPTPQLCSCEICRMAAATFWGEDLCVCPGPRRCYSQQSQNCSWGGPGAGTTLAASPWYTAKAESPERRGSASALLDQVSLPCPWASSQAPASAPCHVWLRVHGQDMAAASHGPLLSCSGCFQSYSCPSVAAPLLEKWRPRKKRCCWLLLLGEEGGALLQLWVWPSWVPGCCCCCRPCWYRPGVTPTLMLPLIQLLITDPALSVGDPAQRGHPCCS